MTSLKGLEKLRNLSLDISQGCTQQLEYCLEQLLLLETLKLRFSRHIGGKGMYRILSAVFRGCHNLKELDVGWKGGTRYELGPFPYEFDCTKGMFKNCAISLVLYFELLKLSEFILTVC